MKKTLVVGRTDPDQEPKQALQEVDRFTMQLSCHYEQYKKNPTSIRMLAEALQQPCPSGIYVRQLELSGSMPLDVGWVVTPGVVVIANVTHTKFNRLPSKEQLDFLATQSLKITFPQGDFLLVRPGMFNVLSADSCRDWTLEAMAGTVHIELGVVPVRNG